MRAYIENKLGKTELPLENGKHTLGLFSNNFLVELSRDEEAKVVCSNHVEIFNGEGEYRIPISWSDNNNCTVSIRTVQGFVKYILQLENVRNPNEEDILNLYKLVDQLDANFIIGKNYQVTDLYEAIIEDRVSLIIEKTPFVGYDDKSLLNKIFETVPMVMDICSHPKQSLRTEEAIQDVNLVKRINSRTMDHLASHSEHWKARTLNGLIPNRLRADIFEDEINIYENLFFRMAVDEILKYIHRQVTSLEKTIQQNDNTIDWNAYGNTLYDYKRMRIFKQLLPDYDLNEKMMANISLENLLKQWRKLEKHFSTIEASQFYRSIDGKKRISRSIKPTNILKKDSRYNALYRLWCEIQRQIVLEQKGSKDVIGTSEISLSDCYSMYVVILLLYIFKILGYDIDETSVFKLQKDGSIIVKAYFKGRNMNYSVSTEKNQYGTLEIRIKYVEKVEYIFHIPEEVLTRIEMIKAVLPKSVDFVENKNNLIFHTLLSSDEKKVLKNVFHLGKTAKRGMSKEDVINMDRADAVWRQGLEDYFATGLIRDARFEEIRIIPHFSAFSYSENDIAKATQIEFDNMQGKTIFTVPIDICEYRGCIKTNKIFNRMFNYGEKHLEEDAAVWGNYKIGMIPIAQTEINSAQRLMKLISTHETRLRIQWQKENVICPICGTDQCSEESKNSWKCNNLECGVLFGITKHDKEKGGCGEIYEWTRPYVSIKEKDVITDNYLDYMLKKDLIFDRLTITDFDFKKQDDGSVKYIPVCPKCGKR